MTTKTWTIRDQMPDGSWGPEREVTLAQFLAETKAKQTRAVEIFKRNAKTVRA